MLKVKQMGWILSVLSAGFWVGADEEQDPVPLPAAMRPVPQADGWAVEWWGARHEEKLGEIRRDNVDLLMIGDSIMHQWENSGRKVWMQYYQSCQAVNLGFSGDRTEHVLWRLQQGEIANIKPRVAVLLIGTNNTGHRMDPAMETAQGVQLIIQELQNRLPETRILLLAVFPRGVSSDDPMRKRNEEINTIISTYADDEKIFFLNVNSIFLDDDGMLLKALMPDGLHPAEAGYARWAEAMEPTLAKLLAPMDEGHSPSGETSVTD